jgi:glucose uptake protein
MLVAGKRSQVYGLAGGMVFSLGNMLLVAAMSLIGLSAAFPLAIGTALIITSLFHFQVSNLFYLATGMLLLLVAVTFDGSACRLRHLALAKPINDKSKNKAPARNTKLTKGVVVALLSGAVLGLFYPVLDKGLTGDLGLGPYAGILLFCMGIFFSMLVFFLYFMNVVIEGRAVSIKGYFKGSFAQHAWGVLGGVICAAGLLCAGLAISAPTEAQPSRTITFIVPLASVLLAFLWGVGVWREFKVAPRSAKGLLAASAVCLAGGLAVLGIGIAH